MLSKKPRCSSFPLLTEAMVEQLAGSARVFTLKRLQAAQALPGNPYGIDIVAFGKALALKARSQLLRSKNHVMGLDLANLLHIDGILEFYRSDHVQCSLSAYGEDFAGKARLQLAGCQVYQAGLVAQLVNVPCIEYPQLETNIEIRLLAAEERERYLEVFFRAHGFAEGVAEELHAFEYVENSLPGYHHYLLEIDGEVAAVAAMYTEGVIASEFNASVLPAFRGRGLQRLLIEWRLAEAHRLGSQLVSASASRFSASHRNLERTGFRYVCFGSEWKDYGT